MSPLKLSRRHCLSWGVAALVTPWQASEATSNELALWADVLRRWRPDQLLLLGEVHDNVAQHRSRWALLKHLIGRGWRPVILMEQLDRHQQAAIDRARKRPSLQAPELLDALGGEAAGATGGWDWPAYLPFIELALRHGLPLVAANVPRQEARTIMSDGLRAHGFTETIPADIHGPLKREILASHCGALPASVAERMVLAQVARDQFMARMLAGQGRAGAVLLAGNGHVRKDVGVPRWLPAADRARALSVGLLESGDVPPDVHDVIVVTSPQVRPDPCAATP